MKIKIAKTKSINVRGRIGIVCGSTGCGALGI